MESEKKTKTNFQIVLCPNELIFLKLYIIPWHIKQHPESNMFYYIQRDALHFY